MATHKNSTICLVNNFLLHSVSFLIILYFSSPLILFCSFNHKKSHRQAVGQQSAHFYTIKYQHKITWKVWNKVRKCCRNGVKREKRTCKAPSMDTIFNTTLMSIVNVITSVIIIESLIWCGYNQVRFSCTLLFVFWHFFFHFQSFI